MFKLLGCFLLCLCSLQAAPSSVFWTVCTTSVYPTGNGHLDADNYFTIFNKRGENSSLPPDIGFECGIFSWEALNAEAGIDYMGGEDNPLYFNVGIALEEGTLFSNAPSIKVGFFNAGTRYGGQQKTDQNIVDIILGKELPDWIGGNFYVGAFSGSRAMGKNRQGFMVSYTRPFCKTVHCDGREYDRWIFCADYASGKNTIGGGGVALYYYFTPDIDIVSGPVFFNTNRYNGSWKWSIQLDFNFSLFKF